MRWAAATAVLAAGAGLGTYFALQGAPGERPPPGQRNPILERARAQGIISGYRVRGTRPTPGNWRYVVTGSEIEIQYRYSCADHGCPQAESSALFVDYRHTAARQARGMLKIARAQLPHTRIYFGPPYYP